MIIFKPEKSFKSRFKEIDFEVLSLVYSLLFDCIYNVKKKRNYTLYLKRTKRNYSYYTFQQGRFVRICISDDINGIKAMNAHLLHEFRHFMQDKVFRITLTKKNYDESSTKSYLLSPVEIDAISYEINIGKKVLSNYLKLVELKIQFIKKSKYIGNKIK